MTASHVRYSQMQQIPEPNITEFLYGDTRLASLCGAERNDL